MAYVLDTSALIGAWVRVYPPDVMPGLWSNLDQMAERGQLHAPPEVLDEIAAQDDDLSLWIKRRERQIIIPTSRDVLLEARRILAIHPRLTMVGKGRGIADPFVIALAAIKGCPVVTHEEGGSPDKPRIPFVCGEVQVRSMNMLGLIRAERMSF